MSDHDPQTARAGRVRMAAAVLFFSGALIGLTLDRVSIWLLPGQGAPPPPVGQISRALEPPEVGVSHAAQKAAATPEGKLKAEGRVPEIAVAPSAPSENTARESYTVGTERPPMTPTTPGPVTTESKPEAVAAPQQPAPPAPTVTLLNPGAVQTETAKERPTQGAKDKAATRDETAPRRRRERRAAPNADEDSPTGGEREPRRDYRSLREEMLRR